MITRLNCSIFCRCSFVILLMSIFSIVNIHAHSDLHKLLDTLDNVIKNKLEYVDFKQKRIDSLKNEFTGNDTIALFRTAQAISIEYSSFQKDSALNYSMRMMNLANSTKKYELISKAKFNRARLLSSMGHFNEATNLVSSVNIGKLSHELKIEYFSLFIEILMMLLDKLNNIPWDFLSERQAKPRISGRLPVFRRSMGKAGRKRSFPFPAGFPWEVPII